MLFSLELMTSLGAGVGTGRGPGEARHSIPPWPSSFPWVPVPPPKKNSAGQATAPTPVLSPASSGSSAVGWLSPTVLAPPGLVGVKEALAEEQGVQGHALQLRPLALL